MTAQMHDTFIYQEDSYHLVAMTSKNPFHPTMFGIDPIQNCTACAAGFVVTYALIDDQFCINRLATNDANKAKEGYVAPKVFGVAHSPNPTPKGGFLRPASAYVQAFDLVYENIDHLIEYTGTMFLGKNPVIGFQESAKSVRFHVACKYAEVHQLNFDKGILTNACNISDEVAEKRAAYTEAMQQPADLLSPEYLPSGFKKNAGAFDKWLKGNN